MIAACAEPPSSLLSLCAARSLLDQVSRCLVVMFLQLIEMLNDRRIPRTG